MKGRIEVRRMLDERNKVPAAEVTRGQAFDLIQGYATRIPVQVAKLRAELGAAWNYAIDAGRLAETVPDWWQVDPAWQGAFERQDDRRREGRGGEACSVRAGGW